jgi:hypothetical protein
LGFSTDLAGPLKFLEVIVHADLGAVELDRTAVQAARNYVREVGLAVQVAVQIFGLHGPMRREHHLDAGAGSPTAVDLTVRSGDAHGSGAHPRVRPRKTGGAVEQDLVEDYAEAASSGAEIADLGVAGDGAGNANEEPGMTMPELISAAAASASMPKTNLSVCQL